LADLEAREREAEARAKMVAHKAQARTVQSLRADNIALMERINAELAASKASATAGRLRLVSCLFSLTGVVSSCYFEVCVWYRCYGCSEGW
jgi:hypothetical protein